MLHFYTQQNKLGTPEVSQTIKAELARFQLSLCESEDFLHALRTAKNTG